MYYLPPLEDLPPDDDPGLPEYDDLLLLLLVDVLLGVE